MLHCYWMVAWSYICISANSQEGKRAVLEKNYRAESRVSEELLVACVTWRVAPPMLFVE